MIEFCRTTFAIASGMLAISVERSSSTKGGGRDEEKRRGSGR